MKAEGIKGAKWGVSMVRIAPSRRMGTGGKVGGIKGEKWGVSRVKPSHETRINKGSNRCREMLNL